MQNSRLLFSGKAILHSEGVDFSGGQSFSLRLSDLLPQEELGRGNYGTVVHVIHRVTNAHLAMKQIKLELDNSKFMAIITELQVLSRQNLTDIGVASSKDEFDCGFLRWIFRRILCIYLYGICFLSLYVVDLTIDGWRKFG